jgi:hypothetical protein
LFGLLFVVSPFLYAMYKAIEWRWWVAGIRFGDVSFESGLGTENLVGLYWKVIGWAVLLTIGLSMWSGAAYGIALALSSSAASGDQVTLLAMQHPIVWVAGGLGYICYILAFWAVTRIYLIHDLWQRVASSVTVHNLALAVDVAEQGQTVSALGEGLADSLDIGGL